MTAVPPAVDQRARLSLGRSDSAIHATVRTLLIDREAGGTLVDVGCGSGDFWRAVRGRFTHCIGVDAVRYDGLAAEVEFRPADLDGPTLPVADASADVVVAIEVIEHLENPRALLRAMTRAVRPGGWVVVTTPNQLSALSLLTLACKGRFAAFQDAAYPAHRTALLAVDLRRIADECGLRAVAVAYTCHGRVPLTPWHYPVAVARLAPARLSDNVVMIARR